MLIHQWKNKGMLVPVYGVTCFVGFNMLLGVLQRNIGGIFNNINFAYSSILGLTVAGIWTYLTCEVYYKDRFGNKKVLDIPHEFYWIKMKHWAYIFWVLAIIFFVYEIAN